MIDVRRISTRDGLFSVPDKGELDTLNVILINAAGISRAYYEGVYDPANPAPPTCWSDDTQRPATEVPEHRRQARRCLDCTQNIRGSDDGGGRACRFSQRLAVVFEDDLGKVYQLQVSAMSIFGQGRGGATPLQAYVKFLTGRSTRAVDVITQIYFDAQSSVPKLFFRPRRPVAGDEAETVEGMVNHADTLRAIAYQPFEVDMPSTSPFSEEDGFSIETN